MNSTFKAILALDLWSKIGLGFNILASGLCFSTVTVKMCCLRVSSSLHVAHCLLLLLPPTLFWRHYKQCAPLLFVPCRSLFAWVRRTVSQWMAFSLCPLGPHWPLTVLTCTYASNTAVLLPSTWTRPLHQAHAPGSTSTRTTSLLTTMSRPLQSGGPTPRPGLGRQGL